ncbi:MAG: MOSC domain-containing protein [Roseiflexaceae bacterium]
MHISALYVYPIKGCRGVALQQADVQPIGLKDDRRYMVIDAHGRFLSQREVPTMAQIDVHPTAKGWQLIHALHGDIAFTPISSGVTRNALIWKNTAVVVDQGDAVATWLSTVLGQSCRLVGLAAGYNRFVNPQYATSVNDAVSFADGFASLLTTDASLVDLNQRLDTPIGMERFRPNIVVAGSTAWAEDDWRELTVGAVRMTAVKPCARCVVTTTDQLTGARHQEPLATLATFRKQALGVIFGQNMVHHSRGIIAVGDRVILSH